MKKLYFLFSVLAAGDTRLFLIINRHCRCFILDAVMSKITHLGGAFFTLFICWFLIFFNIHMSRSAALEALLALCLSQTAVQILKRKIARLRPYLVFKNIHVQKPLLDFSFPSGHTTAGYVLAMSFSYNCPVLFYPLMGLASLIGFSRTYLGFHYPLDVVMGAVIGIGTSYVVHHIMFIL
ncbi:MAG: Phosphoesterase, PA-phosphatase related [Clostridia bacterium 41_269]|nr:MAG: Phosphoesterase, PA-phosphatase related [Clostridia bacterium 41_269]